VAGEAEAVRVQWCSGSVRRREGRRAVRSECAKAVRSRCKCGEKIVRRCAQCSAVQWRVVVESIPQEMQSGVCLPCREGERQVSFFNMYARPERVLYTAHIYIYIYIYRERFMRDRGERREKSEREKRAFVSDESSHSQRCREPCRERGAVREAEQSVRFQRKEGPAVISLRRAPFSHYAIIPPTESFAAMRVAAELVRGAECSERKRQSLKESREER